LISGAGNGCRARKDNNTRKVIHDMLLHLFLKKTVILRERNRRFKGSS
jgi:hypothetical protein